MGKLTNQVAVVTGASKGIGAGIAKALAAEGASIVVNYASSKEGADRVVKEIIAAGGKAVAVQADLSKPAEVTKLFAETKKAYGKLNILVNNAGVYQLAPLEGVTEELFHNLFNLNVLGLLLATKEAVKLIGPEGRQRHQCRLRRQHHQPAELFGLHRDKSSGGFHHRGSRQGAWPAQDPRQFH
jgi:3-oxoacyl-[acyl-carrier protein] reductase